jgi:hypothetical protein
MGRQLSCQQERRYEGQWEPDQEQAKRGAGVPAELGQLHGRRVVEQHDHQGEFGDDV